MFQSWNYRDYPYLLAEVLEQPPKVPGIWLVAMLAKQINTHMIKLKVNTYISILKELESVEI